MQVHNHHDGLDHLEGSLDEQRFNPFSSSVGFVWDFTEGYNLGLSVAYSQRAPSAAELFSFGPHIGTNTFEVGALYEIESHGDDIEIVIGDQDPTLETAMNVDLTLRKFVGDFGFVLSGFYNQVDDFYYQQDTGLTAEHGELPILVFRQDDVDMYGFEGELIYQVFEPLKATLFADVTHAKLSNGDYLPRIPPMRVGFIANYQADSFSGEVSVSRYFEQDEIGELETTTEGYTMVDANVNYYLSDLGIDNDLVLFLKGQNLTNENARVHSSFLKNVAPLPGRGVTFGIRGSF